MSPDHAITPDIIQREMVRLTDTADRVSRVSVQPAEDQDGAEIVVIAFSCDDHLVAIGCMPVHLLLSVEDFFDRVLEPLAQCWMSTKPVDAAEVGS